MEKKGDTTQIQGAREQRMVTPDSTAGCSSASASSQFTEQEPPQVFSVQTTSFLMTNNLLL